MEKIRAIIVDDEKPARRRLRELMEKQPDIAIVAECSNGAEAAPLIRALQPDLLLLDIQMPGLDGFGVVEAIGAAQMPATIFVTAYDQYALKAFEVSALDYLLKPFSDERFERSLARVLSFVRANRREELSHRILSLLDQIQPKQPQNTSAPHQFQPVRKCMKTTSLASFAAIYCAFTIAKDEESTVYWGAKCWDLKSGR